MLIHHIEYLLQSHDCVIVPGLGALLAHGLPAYYDDAAGRWVAPRRAVSFNPELSRTDGLLASSVARRDNISLEAATAIVRREADAMRRTLESEGRVSLGIAGSLDMLPDGRLSFAPGDISPLSPSYMWLPAVDMQPLTTAAELDSRRMAEYVRRNSLASMMRRAGQIAACIALVAVLGWVVARNMAVSPSEQFASLFPFADTEADAPTIAEPASPVILILSQAPKDEVIENIMPASVVKKAELRNDAAYYLIVASCSSQAEAERYLRQHNDINLGILAKDGRFRIYAASGDTAEAVMAASRAEDIASRYPSSWVCRR